jgi:hypothetical protein
LLFIAQCSAQPKNTIFLRNIKNIFFPANCTGQLQTLDLGIIHVLKCHYNKQLIWKTVVKMEGGTTPRCCAYENRCVTCSALHSRILQVAKNQEMSVTFSIYHVSRNDSSGTKLTEDEKNDWHSLQPLGLHNVSQYP